MRSTRRRNGRGFVSLGDGETMRSCKRCGCTDTSACSVLGVPCCWVEIDLCSACATLRELVRSEDAGLPWAITVMGEYAGRVLSAQDVASEDASEAARKGKRRATAASRGINFSLQ